MRKSEFNNIEITGLTVASPTKKVPVTHFYEEFGREAVDKFSKMTGVKSVSRSIPEQTASDLGYEAARNLIEKKQLNAEEIGVLLFVTQKPDYRVPATAYVLHNRLGLSDSCTCFDINLACSGYVYGLSTIFALLQNSEKNKALLITADTSVKTLSPKDRTMIMLFGDSGSATLIEKKNQTFTSKFAFKSDGNRFKSIITPSGAYRNRDKPFKREEWSDGIVRSDYDTHMKGMDVFGFSITDVPALMNDFLKDTQTTVDDYDYFALHQANKYILKQISRKLKVPMEKIPIVLDRFGNNSSNSIPLVIGDHFGNIEDGENRYFICGFGAGLSWACGDITIHNEHIFNRIETDNYYNEGRLNIIS